MKISVIIPAYNVEKTLVECVESIISQGITDCEILIVNDGSTDSTLTVCNELKEKNEAVRVISQANSGVSVARNTGIQAACGEWLIFVDGDDALQPESLNKVNFDVKEDLLVFGYRKKLLDEPYSQRFSVVCETAETMKKIILNKAGYPDYMKKVQVLDSVSCWTCWGKAFRRNLILQNQIKFPEGITHGEDLIFNYRYCSVAKNIQFVDIPVYYYRITEGSVAHRFNPNRLKNTDALLKTLMKEPEVENSEDFNYFVFDRLYNCCHAYFGKENTSLTKEQKVKLLGELCEAKWYKKSLTITSIRKLSAGKKTRMKKWYTLQLLKRKKYESTIRLYNGECVLSRFFD